MAKDALPGEEMSEAPPDEGRHAPDEDREGDGQDYIDRDKIDFDPDEGLLSGTALDGTSDIPGPHEDEPDGDGDGGDSAGQPEGESADDADDADEPADEADEPASKDDDRPTPQGRDAAKDDEG